MKNILAQLKKITGFCTYGPKIQPVRDWLVLLGVFAGLLSLSVGWNLWQVSQVMQGHTIGTATSSAPIQLNLDQVKGLFENRAAEQQRYQTEYRFVDPSV